MGVKLLGTVPRNVYMSIHMDKQPMTLIHTCGRSTEGETRDRSKRVLVKGKRVSKSWVLR